jgi:hypothetical protein
MLEASTGCFLCNSWLHQKDDCVARCKEKMDGKVCLEFHNSLIHGCDLPYIPHVDEHPHVSPGYSCWKGDSKNPVGHCMQQDPCYS